MKQGIGRIIIIAALGLGSPALALETDQYTAPAAPLADISPQLQQKVRAALQKVVSQTNIAYLDHCRAAETSWLPMARQHHQGKANHLQTEDAIAEQLYDALGSGLIETDLETWIRTNSFPQGQHLASPSIGKSIYGANPFGKPPTLLEISPTVNLFGHYLGTDKIGHFFQQGGQYYQAFRKAQSAGSDAATCVREAVSLGILQEENYFGLLTVGVYSNADLAANYAGLKFFLNLTRPVMLNGRRLPPILIKRQDLWEINRELPADFLRPFVTEHWNEAINPNLYTDVLLDTVRARFAERSAAWSAFYSTNPVASASRSRNLETFYGEPYGHSGMDRVSTVADLIREGPAAHHVAAKQSAE